MGTGPAGVKGAANPCPPGAAGVEGTAVPGVEGTGAPGVNGAAEPGLAGVIGTVRAASAKAAAGVEGKRPLALAAPGVLGAPKDAARASAGVDGILAIPPA
uniref:Uncharacterized protein n=1 Tax=Alexandrium catenella TaxID=2925 RepID=A0A7S1RHX9_ALECA|mmetsp:Transcript_58426/g.156419  ORF Transcript_58426/g.156419 Transcript_58426/m.156419 type:complete len:101 (+) Transcript_58426:160-462(+)